MLQVSDFATMWNVLARWNQDLIAQPAVATASEALGANLGAKRHRRPSVRLGEIGDQPATFISEPYFKRKKPSVVSAHLQPQTTHLKQGDHVSHAGAHVAVDSNTADGKASKVSKTLPPIYETFGHCNEQISCNVRSMPLDSSISHSVTANKMQTELRVSSAGGLARRDRQNAIKTSSGKVGNGKRRRGGQRTLAPLEKPTKAVPSIIEIDDENNEKASGLDDTTDPHSDEAYDADTPEGFRDCDLEASEYSEDAKEMSVSQDVRSSDTDKLARTPLKFQQEYRSLEVAGKCALQREAERVDTSEGRECSTNNLVGRKEEDREPNSDAELKPITGVNAIPLQQGRVKLASDTNKNVENKEVGKKKTKMQFEQNELLGRECSFLVNGVRDWLQSLGLGKYAQLFETHEVDADVLPLLTLDDLKDMGVIAVGSRRKMLYAIQQLGKSLMGRADSF